MGYITSRNDGSEDKKDAYTIEATGTLEDLYTQLADLYMKEFSEEEIKTLNTFYESDLGKKTGVKANRFNSARHGYWTKLGYEASRGS